MIRPNDGPGPGVDPEPPEKLLLAKRLEDTSIVEEIRQIDLRRKAILKSNMDQIALGYLCVDQERRAAHESMVKAL